MGMWEYYGIPFIPNMVLMDYPKKTILRASNYSAMLKMFEKYTIEILVTTLMIVAGFFYFQNVQLKAHINAIETIKKKDETKRHDEEEKLAIAKAEKERHAIAKVEETRLAAVNALEKRLDAQEKELLEHKGRAARTRRLLMNTLCY